MRISIVHHDNDGFIATPTDPDGTIGHYAILTLDYEDDSEVRLELKCRDEAIKGGDDQNHGWYELSIVVGIDTLRDLQTAIGTIIAQSDRQAARGTT